MHYYGHTSDLEERVKSHNSTQNIQETKDLGY
ncbi:MAG: hypothetical protein JJU13_02875 [Balneolaceae bacterium]|nr:hypothetical protein [Balneolaceae bacterium]